MNELEQRQVRGIEIAKAGFENAQARIVAMDTKVGIVVGMLGILLPTPMVVVGWLTGLEASAGKQIFWALKESIFLSGLLAAFLLFGMGFAFIAVIKGITCLSPRFPKGYEKTGPFHNEWRPNMLFPIHAPEKSTEFGEHAKKLKSGVDLPFIVDEYDHQLHQLGWILREKCREMKSCFLWLKVCLICYGFAVCVATLIGMTACIQAVRVAL